MSTHMQKGAIALNGINAYINWKVQVANQDFDYDENGNMIMVQHPNAEIYISEKFGKFDAVKWDQD